MQVHARWFDAASGQITEATFDAPTPESARQQLQTRALLVLSIDELRPRDGRRSAGLAWRNAFGRPRFDPAWWCAEVRVLLAAGMTVVEAIETMLAQSRTGATRDVNADLLQRLQQGASLSRAMAGAGVFPGVLIAGVTAGERSGAMVDALDAYLGFHRMIDAMRRQVASAALYPLMVLGIGAAIGLFLLLFVMPRFATIYADLPQAAGGLTGWVLGASRLLAEHGGWVAAAGLALVGLGVWWWRSGGLGRAAEFVAEAVPPVRSRVDQFRLAKLYQALALMFRGGYTLDDALLRCQQMGLGARMTRAVARAHALVSAGRAPADALGEAALLDEVALRLVRVGERSGQFDRVLTTIAQRHAQRFATTVERLTRVAEPAMLLLVALAVGSLVVLMYLPVFDIAASVR